MYSLFQGGGWGWAAELEEEAVQVGAHLGAPAEEGSNANTDTATGEIRIAANKSSYEAALSYVYELTNAKNSARYNLLTQNPGRPSRIDDDETIRGFLMQIFLIEAESILNRARLTIDRGWMEMEAKKNPKRTKYIEIARSDATEGAKLRRIAEIMYAEGTVGSGRLVREVYTERFLRRPTAEELARVAARVESATPLGNLSSLVSSYL
jgi:hypothetical protein